MLFNATDILTEAEKKTVITPGKKLNNADYTVGADDPVDDGTQGDANDYTDEETDATPTDTPEDTGDTADNTDTTDDSGATDYTDMPDDANDPSAVDDAPADAPEDPEDTNKKLALLTDFIQFYKSIKDIIEKISDTKKTNLLIASVLNQVNKNLGILEENVFQFVYRIFPTKKYVECLYQYNCFIEAFKINIEMLKKIKYLDIG